MRAHGAFTVRRPFKKQQPGMQLQSLRRDLIAVPVLACLELNSGWRSGQQAGNEIVALLCCCLGSVSRLCILPVYVSSSPNSPFRVFLALGPTPGGGFRGRGTPANIAFRVQQP